MPTYDYFCNKCNAAQEIRHSIHEDPEIICAKCKNKMMREIGMGCYVSHGGINGSLDDKRELEHKKKVKDPERAWRKRKNAFGSAEAGKLVEKNDPRHVIKPNHVMKQGKVLGGSEKDIDKGEFIKAAAKDPMIVKQCEQVLKKTK